MADELGECKQLQLLRVALRSAAEDVLDHTTSNDNTLTLFDKIPVSKKKIANYFKILREKVLVGMERDMENIIKDAEFDEVLRKREVILQQNKQWEGTIAWRPTGSPIEDLRSRDMEVLQKKAQQMEEMCQAEDNEVNALQSEVEALWKRILSTEDTFNNSGVMFQTFLDQLVNDEVALSHNTNILYTV